MSEPATPLNLDVLRKLAEAATPGPWTAHDDGLVWPERMGDPVSGSVQLDDAEFIAAARTAVPALLAALEEARREADAMRQERDEIAALLDITAAARDQQREHFKAEAAETRRMRPVVEAIRTWKHGALRTDTALSTNDIRSLADAVLAAVDTYETQTGGTE